ncbi:MAG: hypothetical protein MUP63_04380 [Candidatus Nanohaloarchaeota archaeon QJJ-7]|nr:hypothetical protein [Candidatus Nanohaloarchaeota archaeon QJJ-7]
MASLDEIAENSAAYVVEEHLEPEGRISDTFTTRQFADALSYPPGQISRAWKEVDFEDYDVSVEKVDRAENRIRWHVEYDPESDDVPELTGPVDPGEDQWEETRHQLEKYDITISCSDVLESEYMDIYTEALESLREQDMKDMELINLIASHDLIQENYDSVQARFRHAAERLSDLRKGIEEVEERQQQAEGATKTFLSLE